MTDDWRQKIIDDAKEDLERLKQRRFNYRQNLEKTESEIKDLEQVIKDIEKNPF